ncbi:hypothetical protein IG631_05002 [Alternaria alternata]|nr:hypothetical protein IG631_05002 [Alternaria alternata]
MRILRYLRLFAQLAGGCSVGVGASLPPRPLDGLHGRIACIGCILCMGWGWGVHRGRRFRSHGAWCWWFEDQVWMVSFVLAGGGLELSGCALGTASVIARNTVSGASCGPTCHASVFTPAQ